MCYFFILSWDNNFVVCAWGHTGHFVSESYTQFVDSASLVPFGCNVDLKDWPVDVDLGLSRLWIPLAPDWRVYLQYTLSQYFAHNPQHATLICLLCVIQVKETYKNHPQMSFCTGLFCDKDNKTYIHPNRISVKLMANLPISSLSSSY